MSGGIGLVGQNANRMCIDNVTDVTQHLTLQEAEAFLSVIAPIDYQKQATVKHYELLVNSHFRELNDLVWGELEIDPRDMPPSELVGNYQTISRVRDMITLANAVAKDFVDGTTFDFAYDAIDWLHDHKEQLKQITTLYSREPCDIVDVTWIFEFMPKLEVMSSFTSHGASGTFEFMSPDRTEKMILDFESYSLENEDICKQEKLEAQGLYTGDFPILGLE